MTGPRRLPPFTVRIPEEEIEAIVADVRSILTSGRLSLGSFTADFESRFATLCDRRFAVAVSSGTAALEIILRGLDVAGSSVLVPCNTNFATAAAVHHAGGRVLLYDSGLYPSLREIQRHRSSDTRVLVVVHIGGYIAPNLKEIAKWCEAEGINLIEDAAHAHGSALGETPAGAFGIAAAFSFFPTKVVTTGEGGMVVTNNEEIAKVTRSFRDQGKGEDPSKNVRMGSSWRMPEISAAVGLRQLEGLNESLARRRAFVDRLDSLVGESVGWLTPVARSPALRHSCYKAIYLLREGLNRERAAEELARFGVSLGGSVYHRPLHRQPVFRPWADDRYPLADEFADTHVCLPVWRGMYKDEEAQILDALVSARP